MNFFNGELAENGKTMFKNKSFKIQIPEEIVYNLTNEKRKNIILGVRPEDFMLESSDKEALNSIEAIVEVIEPMGSENYLYVRANDQSFIIKTAPTSHLKVNDRIKLFINLQNIHLFDEKSSKSLVKVH